MIIPKIGWEEKLRKLHHNNRTISEYEIDEETSFFNLWIGSNSKKLEN